jgi:hypothetical protein
LVRDEQLTVEKITTLVNPAEDVVKSDANDEEK